jgi:hypothetical protein
MNEAITDSNEPVTDRPLNLPEYFLLLCLDDEKGRLLLDGPTVGLGLAGATLAELARRGRLAVTQTTVHSIDRPEQASTADLEWPLEQVWDIIRAFTRRRDAEQWINRFSRQSLRDAVAASRVKRGSSRRTRASCCGCSTGPATWRRTSTSRRSSRTPSVRS